MEYITINLKIPLRLWRRFRKLYVDKNQTIQSALIDVLERFCERSEQRSEQR